MEASVTVSPMIVFDLLMQSKIHKLIGITINLLNNKRDSLKKTKRIIDNKNRIKNIKVESLSFMLERFITINNAAERRNN